MTLALKFTPIHKQRYKVWKKGFYVIVNDILLETGWRLTLDGFTFVSPSVFKQIMDPDYCIYQVNNDHKQELNRIGQKRWPEGSPNNLFIKLLQKQSGHSNLEQQGYIVLVTVGRKEDAPNEGNLVIKYTDNPVAISDSEQHVIQLNIHVTTSYQQRAIQTINTFHHKILLRLINRFFSTINDGYQMQDGQRLTLDDFKNMRESHCTDLGFKCKFNYSDTEEEKTLFNYANEESIFTMDNPFELDDFDDLI